MSITYTGTDLIGQDDLTASPWFHANVTIAPAGSTAGPGGFAAYSATVDSDGGSRNLNGNNRTVTTVPHYCFVWIKAGTVDSADVGVLAGSWGVTAAQLVYGPGSVAVASSRCTISGLSSSVWSLARYRTEIGSTEADYLMYPNAVTGQSAGDSVLLGPQRMSTVASSPAWSIRRVMQMIHSRRSRGM